MFRKLNHLPFPFVLLFIISCTSDPEKPEVAQINKANLFVEPATNSCHAATIVEVEPNHLLSAWFGGSYEGAQDVGIWSSSYNGKAWSKPENLVKPLITETDTLPCWNPVLFKSQSEHLYLFYKVGKNPREWFGAMISSTDNGQSWSVPQYLPEGILGPIRNKPIEVSPGVILCGSSTESVETNEWRTHVEIFTEGTGNWEKIPVSNTKEFEVIQPTLLTHSDGSIQMLCRSKHDKVITSWSSDKGRTWSDMDSLNVFNSNSGIDALTLPNHTFLLVNNPLPRGADWYNGRNLLDVEYSSDGQHWETLFDLENEKEGEFSYPAIIQSTDGKIHVVYTFNRKFIKHASFDVK